MSLRKCIDCGKKVNSDSTRCQSCNYKYMAIQRTGKTTRQQPSKGVAFSEYKYK